VNGKKRYFFLFSDLLIRARVNRKQKGSYIFIEKVSLTKLELSRTLGSDVKDLVTKEMRSKAFEINHPHPIRYILAATTKEDMTEWYDDIERLLVDIKDAEAKHEEAVLKISAQKATVAKSIIAQSLMQHTVKVGNQNGNFRERLQNVKTSSQQKSKTVVDPYALRAYSEQMGTVRRRKIRLETENTSPELIDHKEEDSL